jgi:hypothetical protein
MTFLFYTKHYYLFLGLAQVQDSDPEFECPDDGQFAHPDCWKWYNCGGGIAHVQECPNDWLYDPDNNWCETVDNVDCGDRNPRP